MAINSNVSATNTVDVLSRPSKMPDKNFSDELNRRSDQVAAPQAEEPQSKQSQIKDTSAKRTESSPREQQEQAPQSKTVSRQAAMEMFLNRMQDQLGVAPEKIVEAFSKLDLADLAAPPEESAAKLISELDLNSQDSQKALGFYNEMLAMSAAAGMAQYLQQNNQQADFQVMTKKEAQIQELRSSIGDMSDRFFITGQHAQMPAGVDQQAKVSRVYAAQKGEAPLAGLQKSDPFVKENPEEMMMGDKAKLGETSDSKTGFVGMGLGNGSLDVSELKPVQSPEFLNAPVEPLSVPLPSNEVVPELQKEVVHAKMQNPAVPPNELNAPAAGAQDNLNLNAKVANEMAVNTPNAVAPLGTPTLTGNSANGSEGEFDDSDQADGQPLEALGAHSLTAEKTLGGKSFSMEAPKPTTADVQQNVKEIISQAQFLAKKGGGEMKVKLNPEGMGELNLKVKIVNGQVNVEMVTSSDSAKKILEKGLGELKESLASHQLHLDSIKIDHSKEISSQLDQQRREAEQGFQHKFLSDFRDNNQNFRREMFEFGAPSVPSSQTRDRAANAVYDPTTKRRSETSRRLDLVA